jgi:hypothetical protein
MRQSAARSWMQPAAKKSDLLYVSMRDDNVVFVFSYPKGKLLGELTGFDYPYGECADRAGNVWITNSNYEILEYAHGGTKPIAVLTNSGEYPIDCSVDPTTGNLAVTQIAGRSTSLAVYERAQGTPTTYTDSSFSSMYYCGYDNTGNLFVDGEGRNAAFAFGELPAGGSSFTNVKLDSPVSYPGGVQWDGRHVAIGDQGTGTIDAFDVSGGIGTKISSTPLTGSADVNQFSIAGRKVVGPDSGNNDVGFWRYPGGGVAIKVLGHTDVPVGSAVSVAH